MGRPSKSEERREQILDAFEAVILREGYSKASQRRIAEEAGLNQPMIHHYFSGGEELLDALLRRVMDRYVTSLAAFTGGEEAPGLERIISFVASKEFHSISLQNRVFFALIGQIQARDPARKKLTAVYQRFLSELTEYLQRAKIANANHLAYMVMCFVLGHDWAKNLGFGEHRNEDVARSLLRLTLSD